MLPWIRYEALCQFCHAPLVLWSQSCDPTDAACWACIKSAEAEKIKAALKILKGKIIQRR